MNNFTLITEYSPFFIILCIAAGTLYAFLLYSKKHVWSRNINILLAVSRGILVAVITFLLLGPLVKYISNKFEKPTIVFAIDNSASLAYVHDSTALQAIKEKLAHVAKDLGKSNSNVEIRLLDKVVKAEAVSSLDFSGPATNLSKLITDIQTDYLNRNLAGIVLATDGIYNEGTSPSYLHYTTPVYTIGLGDTVPKKDINLKSLLFNRITYTGNQFPIVAEIHNSGFKNQNINVLLKKNNKVLQRKAALIKREKEIITIEFQVNSDQRGLQHYSVEVEPLKEEFTTGNNSQHAYIDVIDGKEKILLLAAAPHPDIKAIRSAIEKKNNYELRVVIPGISQYKPDKYDLIIYHQIPNQYNDFKDLSIQFDKEQIPALYILGVQSNIFNFNQTNKIENIAVRQGQWDLVSPVLNDKFEKFKFEEDDKKIISSYPPISVPFGNYTTSPSAEVVLYQQVGSLATNKPLLTILTSPRKVGVFNGDGLWQWHLGEYKETNDTKTFDRLVTHVIQYLSSKEDKRKFRCFPVENDFLVTEEVLFESEIYNDVYEKVYGQNINLKITDESGTARSYSFINGENSHRFHVKGLKEGIYKYSASTVLSGKTERSNGEFTIRDLNLEALSTTADHNLLKSVSAKSGGVFFGIAEVDQLKNILKGKKLQSLIHTSEEYDEIINLKWVFFVLLFFISLEWFIRKYKGSY